MTTVAVFLSLTMALAWAVQRRSGNARWVDAFWSSGTAVAGLAFALAPFQTPGLVTPRRLLVALLVLAWSSRLLLRSLERALAGHENARYANLRRHWGERFQFRFFALLQLGSVAALLLSLAILTAARNPEPDLRPADWIAAIILLASVLGAAAADRQLGRFQAEHRGERRVYDGGLWAWSRHPNYFFEWLGWAAYPLIAAAPPADYSWSWLALAAPVFMYWLLVHVWGIPYSEALLVARFGDAYRAYQARTGAFVPRRPALRPPDLRQLASAADEGQARARKA